MKVERYVKPDWFSREGVALKRAALERKGIPDMKNWRFFTLTLDPSRFDSETEGYLAGKDRMRRFLAELKNLLGVGNVPWCWKMEFHANGWVHWHLCFCYKRKLTEGQMRVITSIWGLGMVNCKRIVNGTLDYLFKYVSKAVFVRDEGQGHDSPPVPEWFLDYLVVPAEGKKAATFSRARFWQASEGFYTNPPEGLVKPSQKKSSLIPYTLREMIGIWSKTFVLKALDESTNEVTSCTMASRFTWSEINLYLSRLCELGEAAAHDIRSFICGNKTLEIICLHKKRLKELAHHHRADSLALILHYQRQWREIPF